MIELISSLPSKIDFLYLPVALIAMFVHFFLEPLRWHIYVSKLFKLDYKRIFSIFSLTALVSYLLPMKMGIPTRIFLLRIKAKINIVQSTSLLMLDGIINYTCWGIAAAVSLCLIIKQDLFKNSLASFVALSIIVLLFLYFIWKKRQLIFPAELRKVINDNNGGVKQLISSIDHPLIFKALLIMPIDIGSHIVHHWAIFSMLGINLEWSAIFVITTVCVFTGLISMMPMGLGGYDAMLILLLTQYSIEPEYAISIAVINRLSSLAISFATGIYGGFQLEMNPFKTKWRKLLTTKNHE
jgi:uncharacterized protein (TIRG00374 family)